MKKGWISVLAGIFFLSMAGNAAAVPVLAGDTGVTYSWNGYAATHTGGYNMSFSGFDTSKYAEAYWSLSDTVFLDLYRWDNVFWTGIDNMSYDGISGNQATWIGTSQMRHESYGGDTKDLHTRFTVTSGSLVDPAGWGLGGAAVNLGATGTTINVLFEVSLYGSSWTAANTYYDFYNADYGSGDVISGFNADLFGEPVPEPVPEPATMLLLGTGITCFAAARRRRKS